MKIIRHDEPIRVETLVTTLYGGPGHGKSTLAASASTPLLIDADGGAHRALGRPDIVRPDRWEDIADLADAPELEGYATVVIDTVGRSLDLLADALIRGDGRLATRHGALSLQGYGALKSTFAGWLMRLRQRGLDVILVAHGTEERDGDQTVERLDIQGGSKAEVHKVSDAMGRIRMVPRGNQSVRTLDFHPSYQGFGKNPGGLEPLAIPDLSAPPRTFMADVLTRIKAALNEETETQRERGVALDAWAERVAEAEALEQVNALIAAGNEMPEGQRKAAAKMVADRAKGLGYRFDRGQGCYVEGVA